MEYRVPCDNCKRTGKENGESCMMCFGEGYHIVSKAEREAYYRNIEIEIANQIQKGRII